MDEPFPGLQVENVIFRPKPLALCGDPSKRWTAGTTGRGKDPMDGRLIITVAILHSNSSERDDFVRRTANLWSLYANIKFHFVTSSERSEIRIKYADESWSYIGIDALGYDQREETMRLKYVNGDEKHNRRSVLHEFGHALGFEHEHSSPAARIQWNREAVIARYRSENFTADDIHRNFFRVAHNATIRSSYDPESIMCYPISQEFVACGMVSIKESTKLSCYDKEWAEEFYPFSTRRERLEIHELISRDETEILGLQARKYEDYRMCRTNTRLDDCFRESGMKVFRCGRPNCRPKNRQCDACLERHEVFQSEGMSMITHPGCWISSYVGSH
ncbi:Metalloprotease [Annulohypoxylon moriforme]|nr:Metalloprotease [Annulohypoxylon moriforme]